MLIQERTLTARPRLLIVDDVEANLTALTAVLEDLDCDVVIARSGEEALRRLLKSEFVAVLLDVQMPGMDGYEVARYARSNHATRDIPILFLTARYGTEEDALRGYDTGAVDYLPKPISPIVLQSKVRVFIELHRKRKEAERAYEELRITQSQLIQSAKMAALGELVAGVAHEINNPLAFTTSHLATAQRCLAGISDAVSSSLSPEQLNNWEKASSRLSEMTHGLTRIAELITQLRTFSRLDEGERKRVHLHECIDSVLMILGHRLSETVTVSVNLDENDELDCYPGPLNLAVMNLVSNAIDAVGEQGSIIISSERRVDSLVIHVHDDGPGVPESLRERIFEPFFTTKLAGKGTGLGLSISYSIAKKHQGSLTLSSAPEQGTTFHLELPLLERKE